MAFRQFPRRRPAATPLQRAVVLPGEATLEADADPATFAAFLSITQARIATESGKLIERERPS